MATANTKLKIDFGFDSLASSNVQGNLKVDGDLTIGGNILSTITTSGDLNPTPSGLNLGNTTNRWTLYANSGNFSNTLTVTGSASLQDTLTVTKTIGGGNTTITGWANASVSVNSAALTVGSSFIANTTGTYAGLVNASSLSMGNATVGFSVNSTGLFPTADDTFSLGFISSNSTAVRLYDVETLNLSVGNPTNGSGILSNKGQTQLSGNTIIGSGSSGELQRIYGNVNFDFGTVFIDSVNNRMGIGNTAPGVAFVVTGAANISTSVNSALLTVGSSFIANTTGAYHTGVVNAGSITVGTSASVNSTFITSSGSANLTALDSTIRIGNSTVNAFVNSTLIATGTGNFSVGANVGANVNLTNTSLLIGNSTVNSSLTNALLSVANSTSSANISPINISIGSFIANTTTMTVNTGNFAIGANVGANVNLTTSSIQVGNSTVNLNANSTLVKVSDATSTANLSSSSLTIGSAVVNSTVLTIGTGNFSTGANVGANVNLTTSTIQLGNSTVNTQVNSSVFSTGTGNFSLGANVGANVNLTTVILSIGNSTVNSTLNSTAVFTGTVNAASHTIGTTLIANTTGVYHTGTVNAASHTIGTTFIANTLGAYHTGTVNAASHTIGTTFIANTTGAYHTGTINAASHTIGTTFIANSSQLTVSGTPFSTNGSVGTAGNALYSNGATGSPYWANTVTSIANGAGLLGGTITTTGTLSVSTSQDQRITFSNAQNVGTFLTTSSSLGGIEIYGAGGANAAFMAFHRPGAYASYFGIDTDSQFAIGGWSSANATNGLLANMKVGSLGVGTAATGTAGQVNAASYIIGTTFIANTTGAYHTGTVNAASHTIGTTFIANTTGAYHTGTMNAASHTVGSNFIANTTGIWSTGDITAFYTSDQRLKSNIVNIESPLDKVMQLNGVMHDWNETALEIYPDRTHRDVGVIAQQVEKVLPEIVITRDTGFKAVRYERLIPLLIEAIKELKQEINELKNGNS